MDDSSDDALMMRVKQGQLEAMAPLFERYHEPLLNYFHRLTGDRETSRDLTQIVFERLLRYRRSFREHARFRPWIYQAARNILADHWRTLQRRNPQRLAASSREDSESAPPEVPDPDWGTRRAIRDVQEALGQLPVEDREVIVLHRFHGLRYDEIALLVGKSAGAVKVQAHRAIQALRRIYFAEEESVHDA